ncbi:MAG: hypothetical protein Kow00114_09030 [Kiloniellaceae bacterium]
MAVIGAGVAGLTAAQRLREVGLSPVVFEKSRGLGGRLATRRTREGFAFDHGAQYITARSAAFRSAVEQATRDGFAARWHPRGRDLLYGDSHAWIVGTPAMNALLRPFAEDLDIRFSTRIASLSRERGGWRLQAEDGTAARFDRVVATLPAPQAAALLEDEEAIADALAGVSMAPCWSLLAAFRPAPPLEFDVLRDVTPDLAWVACSSSKPARDGDAACWVAHAGPGWSRRHLEGDPETVAARLSEMLAQALGLSRLPEPAYLAAHRWRYAMTTAPLGRPFLCTADRSLFVGGDWCLGMRVENAFESGLAIANALSDALAVQPASS